MRRRSVLLSAAASAGLGLGLDLRGGLRAEPGAADWTDAEVNGMQYKLLPPAVKNVPVPVLLYLHQLDLGTYPAELVKQVDPWFNTPSFRAAHPCIVVMPLLDQSKDTGGRQVNFGGKREGHVGEDNTIAAIHQVLASHEVDRTRVYVTGNSLGGMGAWELLLSCNRLTGSRERIFAAGMPVAGTHRTISPESAAQTLRQVPIWAFHGAKDPEISPDWDRTLAKLLSGQPTFHYTEYKSLGHQIWDQTYTRPDIWTWLFAQGGAA